MYGRGADLQTAEVRNFQAATPKISPPVSRLGQNLVQTALAAGTAPKMRTMMMTTFWYKAHLEDPHLLHFVD